MTCLILPVPVWERIRSAALARIEGSAGCELNEHPPNVRASAKRQRRRALFFIRNPIIVRLCQEEASALRSFDWNELAWGFRKIEAVLCRRRGTLVGGREPIESKQILGKAQYAGGFINDVRNVVLLGIWRDYEQRNAEAQA